MAYRFQAKDATNHADEAIQYRLACAAFRCGDLFQQFLELRIAECFGNKLVHVFLTVHALQLAGCFRVVEQGAPAIDLNFGCPAKTENRSRGGSMLLDEPEVVHQLVKAVRDAVPPHMPVSAKMRLGYLDRSYTLANAHAIEDAGAAWLTVHARTKAEGYTPPAFWDQLQPIQHALKINVIANGEIWNNQDAKQCRLESGCADLMLGRGAVTTPDLSQCIRQNIDTALLTWDELLLLQSRFLQGNYKKEINMVGRYKQWLGMMSKHYPQAKTLWNEVKRIKHLQEIIDQLQHTTS